ncbi:M20 family metallopeptidase [Aliikangiella marina]|uniref:M20 family metallopeptidase n=1 Tax=Aliikangiella marina TaxID=1712262 RepID=A0A545T6G5_9GAMM|nr:M20/M25/M40 family metallo-hydrolase [Aliikangiella marina]TQV72814.1 M20 family metallopeptidase [Aliikangiella marina]
MKYFTFLIALSLLSFALPSWALDENEQAIRTIIEKNLATAEKDLKSVVDMNSGTMNFKGVKAVGMFFKDRFDAIGFETEWQDGKAFNRAGHLVASYGKQGPRVLLIGHLDTVFPNNSQFQRYQPLGNNKVKGPGITDMKGGNVIMLYALKALKDSGALDRLSVKVVLTGDEESSGKPLKKSKQAIVDAAKWADYAIGFEDGDGDIKTAVIARRGAINWRLEVTGKPAHSSQIFREDIGDGAIFEAARILNEFRTQLSTQKNLTFNPGMIVGGTTTAFDGQTNQGSAFGKTNIIAKTALITGDIRAVSPEQLTQAKTVMQKIVAKSLAHTQSTLSFSNGYPPMAPSDGNKQLLALYNQVSLDLGHGRVIAVDPRRAGAADISFAANHVKMALDGLGLMGEGGHTKDEVADMTSFIKNMEKAAILLYRLAN